MKKTSVEWLKEYNVSMLDYDGWDRHNFKFSFTYELITREEFENRLGMSTVERNDNKSTAHIDYFKGPVLTRK